MLRQAGESGLVCWVVCDGVVDLGHADCGERQVKAAPLAIVQVCVCRVSLREAVTFVRMAEGVMFDCLLWFCFVFRVPSTSWLHWLCP